MPIPSSTSPAVRAYLFSALTAQLTPDPVVTTASLVVCYDDPGTNQTDDIVAVGKVTRQLHVNSMVGGGGAGWLDESYTVEITVDVFRGNDDAQGAYTRMSTLADAVISAVRSDLTLGGNVLVAKPVSDTREVEWDEAHMGRRATAIIEIECFQRI